MTANPSGSVGLGRSVLAVRFAGAARRPARVGGNDPELVADRLWELGATAVEVDDAAGGTLLAGFDDVALGATAADALRAAHPGLLVEHRVVDDTRLGAVFGDGGHASTRLALDALHALMTPGSSVLDVGTGTGVLARAAVSSGARRVVAIDTDEGAVAVARANLGDAVHVIHGDITAVVGVFDVVVANLGGVLAPLSIAPDLAERTRGALVVSGMLDPASSPGALDPALLDGALAPFGLALDAADELDGWVARRWRRDRVNPQAGTRARRGR